jgi:hypothetical protein
MVCAAFRVARVNRTSGSSSPGAAPPVPGAHAHRQHADELRAEIRREFQKVYDDLRVRYKVGTAALMSPKMAVDLTNFQADGIHPNAEAQPQLLNNVWTPLDAALAPLVKGASNPDDCLTRSAATILRCTNE